MDQDQQSRRRSTLRQVLWTVGIVVALLVLIRIGYALPGTGFGQSKVAQDVRPAKTLWDWLDLLIVPIVLAIGGYLFTRSENRATQAAAERRAQDEALQAYLDHMSDMLIPSKEQPSLYKALPGDSLSSVARARTLTVLPRLDGDRKARVVQFLYEAGLIAKGEAGLIGSKGRPIVDLAEADLIRADLIRTDLGGADLIRANLRGAFLREANLGVADLREADLSGAELPEAELPEADLRGANLREADLREADLGVADLSGADLRGADLREAEGWTKEHLLEQLLAADSLKGAIMPGGQRYEDWLKSKGREENGENNEPL